MSASRSLIQFREFAIQAVLLVVLLACAFPSVFMQAELLVPGDILYEIYPWRDYASSEVEQSDRLILDAITAMDAYYILADEAVDEGEWPLWNHLELGGMPLLANFQTAAFYPPRLVHAMMDPFVATTVYILLKLWLCGMMAYVCMRGIGLGAPASRFASVAWMLGSYNLLWCYWPLPDVSAWVPILFLAVELTLRGSYRKGFFTMALGGTLILLAGHPETAFIFGLGIGFYFFLRLAWERKNGKRPLLAPLAVAGGAWLLALLVCAATILPFAEYMVHSYSWADRALRPTSQKTWMGAGTGVATFIPRFFGTWVDGNFWGSWNSNLTSMMYVGIAVWAAVALLPARSKDRPAGEGARIGCLVASAIPFALSPFGFPGFDRIHYLPIFNTMYECYHLAWPIFVLPMLGAIGIDRWFSQPRKLRQLAWILPILSVTALYAYVVYGFNLGVLRMMGQLDHVYGAILAALLILVVTLVLFAAHCFWQEPRVLIAMLTILLAADLLYSVHGINATSPREELFFKTELTDFLLEQDQPCRVGASMALIPGGLMPIYGIEQWTGYDGIYPERVLGLQKALKTDIWKSAEPIASVQYYLSDTRIEPMFPYDEPGYFDLVETLNGIEVYRNNRAFPRAFLVGAVRVIEDKESLLEVMRSEDFNPSRTVLVESPLPEELPASTEGALGQASVAERKSCYVKVEANASQASVLVLSDAYYPGWNAYVDGKRVAMFPAYYAFRGIVLPEGDHVVEYRYEPRSFYIGLWISCLAMAGSMLGGVLMLVRSRRKQGCA